MCQLIAILVFLSTVLVHATGMFIDTSRKHIHHHHGFRSYKLKEPELSDLSLLGLHKKRNQDWLKWEDKILDNFEDALDEYKRPKRDHNRSSFIHVRDLQKNSLCNFVIESDNVTDSDNTGFSMDLTHIKCRDIDSRCNMQDKKCCMQMYTTINITFSNGKEEAKTIYTGCVYTHPRIDNSTPKLNGVGMWGTTVKLELDEFRYLPRSLT